MISSYASRVISSRSVASSSNSSISCSAENGLNTRQRKNIKNADSEDIKAIVAKTNLEIGATYSEGDCFFDAIAQCLGELTFLDNKQSLNYKQLRILCDQYIKNPEHQNWVKSAMSSDSHTGGDDFHKCLAQIQYTHDEIERMKAEDPILSKWSATWGRPAIEGRIICSVISKQLNKSIQLHVMQLDSMLDDEENKKLVTLHWLINSDGEKDVSDDKISYNDISIIHILNYKSHFVSLLRNKVLNQENYQLEPSTQSSGKNAPVVHSNLAAKPLTEVISEKMSKTPAKTMKWRHSMLSQQSMAQSSNLYKELLIATHKSGGEEAYKEALQASKNDESRQQSIFDLQQRVSLEECLRNLLASIASMDKDQSALKYPEYFSELRDTYEKLSTLKINFQQFKVFIADLTKRLEFYNKVLALLQTKRKAGSFFDQQFGNLDINSFNEFIGTEIGIVIRYLRLRPDMQSELIESTKILIEMFFLTSISDALKLEIISFFRLLDWNSGLEQLREKLLYFIEDNTNTEIVSGCLLLLLDKDIIEPTNFFRIISENIKLASSIVHSCIKNEFSNLLYESIKFFYKHDQLEELIKKFLNVIDTNDDSDWRQKEIAMYGLSKIADDYMPNKLDNLINTIIKRLVNALCNFHVNEYTILPYKKLSSYLIRDEELDRQLLELLQDPLTRQETKEAITEYLDLTELEEYESSDIENNLAERSGSIEHERYKASDVENNIAQLVTISGLSKQQYQDHSCYLMANRILRYMYDMPMRYLCYSDFSEKLSSVMITEFNFTIAIGIIRFSIVTAKCLSDDKLLNKVVDFALALTIRLPNTFLQQNTFQYIGNINRRFSLVPESKLGLYYLQLLPFPDLSASRMTGAINPSDLMLLGLQEEKKMNFDLALRYYHKAENLNFDHRFYASIARARIYSQRRMPYTALEILSDLNNDVQFDLELYELIYDLTGKLGCTHYAVDMFYQINKILPFYHKNILTFQNEIKLPKQHPLSEKFDELYQIIEETFSSNVCHDEAIELGNSIRDHLAELPISRDTLAFCFTVFSPIEHIKSSDHPNEWKRILLNYLGFVFREVASVDYHWQTAGVVHSGQTEDKLKKHIAESEIHEIYHRVFGEVCTVEAILNSLKKAKVETLTVTEFVRRYSHDFQIRGSYALGYSEDIAQTYDIYCFLFGLIRWETAYHKHNISYVNNAKTSEFLDTISQNNKPIVFFLPTGLSKSNPCDDDLSVTYNECLWVLKNIREGNKNIKNVILVFDAYNHLPYHLLTEIKYFHKYGTVFKFNNIESRNFNKKIEVATAAAKYFLTYVVDADKIKSTEQTFIGNIQEYLSINIDSIYSWIENTIESQHSMPVDLKYLLRNCFRDILIKFCQTCDWHILHEQLKQTVDYYQKNHTAVKCLAVSFFEILEDIDFFQNFIVIEQNIALQAEKHQHYLGLLNFISPLMTVYKLTEYLEYNIGIEEAEKKLFEIILLLFQTFVLNNQLEKNIDTNEFFEELRQKNQSEIQDIFEKVNICLHLESLQDKLLEIFPKDFSQVDNLWQTFQASYATPSMSSLASTTNDPQPSRIIWPSLCFTITGPSALAARAPSSTPSISAALIAATSGSTTPKYVYPERRNLAPTSSASSNLSATSNPRATISRGPIYVALAPTPSAPSANSLAESESTSSITNANTLNPLNNRI